MEKPVYIALHWAQFLGSRQHSEYYTFSKFFTISFTLNFTFWNLPHLSMLLFYMQFPSQRRNALTLLDCSVISGGMAQSWESKKELFLNHIITRLACVRCWAASSTETKKSQAYWTCPSSSHTHMHMHTASIGFRRSLSHISAKNGWIHSYSVGEVMTMALISSISPWTMGGIHSMLVCAFITGRTC